MDQQFIVHGSDPSRQLLRTHFVFNQTFKMHPIILPCPFCKAVVKTKVMKTKNWFLYYCCCYCCCQSRETIHKCGKCGKYLATVDA
ncbi:hypothetical protein PVAND_010837 [Polypedilum vanderplanki]|uniref:LITAF domain-containing protein n=1 Tax=Polypedilum vanderplanki TaxID=319348 RepID=A0A9J6CH74_POLVA|nr:hypothetical protein PVAND_010837 [Polypedilum vanderplanki]